MGQAGRGGGVAAQVLAMLARGGFGGPPQPSLDRSGGLPMQAPGFRDPVQLGPQPGASSSQPVPMGGGSSQNVVQQMLAAVMGQQPSAMSSAPLPVNIAFGGGAQLAPGGSGIDYLGIPDTSGGVGPTAAENPSDPTSWLSPYERVNGAYAPQSQGYFDGDGNWVG